MATFASTRAKLKSLIETTLEGAGNPLKEVFDYIETSPQLFPCAMIVPFGASNLNRLDCRDELVMGFLIRVVLNDKNNQATEDLRISVLDEFVDNLWTLANVRDTLDGEVEKVGDIEITPFSTQGEQPLVGIDFLIQATTIKVLT